LSLLSPDQVGTWKKAGGNFLHIGPCGQRPAGDCTFIEDLNHNLLPLTAKGTLVVVRPDRLIMHHASSAEAGQLVQACIDLMASHDSTVDSVSVTISEPPRLRA